MTLAGRPMHLALAIGLAVAACATPASAYDAAITDPNPKADAALLLAAKRAVMKKLAFPTTALFRNLRVVRLFEDHRFDPPRVCGEVTARTKTKGTEPFRPFLYLDVNTVRIYRDPDTPGTDGGHNLLLEWSGCIDHEGRFSK